MTGASKKSTRIFGMVLIVAAGIVLVFALGLLATGKARANSQTAVSQPAQPDQTTDNATCLSCHNQEGQTATLENGDQIYITINPGQYGASVHGGNNMACVACHSDVGGYPHPKLAAQDSRSYSIQQSQTCRTCHADQYENIRDSVHQLAFDAGNTNAPVCTDCHNPHTQAPLTDKQTGKMTVEGRVGIPQTCAKCHNGVYEQYKDSVHGSAMIGDGNPDVATCTDCHGVHQIVDPTTEQYRIDSPQVCATCHTDKTLMDKYGLSTDVLNTYVADFHGTTVTLFQKQSPDQITNKPVCFDCHGVHDIASVNDPQKGLQIRENMLVTCQKCHPGADINFPDSWLSHYIPSPSHAPLVYYVQLFYKIFIPLVLGGMAIFVLSDIYRRLRSRRKGAASK